MSNEPLRNNLEPLSTADRESSDSSPRDVAIPGAESVAWASAGQSEITFHGAASGSALAAEVVRKTTVRVLGERIRLLGVNRSGAYEHYNLLLASGFPIPPYEIAILDLVKRRLPNLRSYHEIGSGLGTLPFMLAHDGLASVGVERDDPRHLTATAILRELSAELPNIESNCRLIGAPFPDAINDLDVSESMAILTDFVASQTPRDYARLCRGLAQYKYILLDLQRFCMKREAKDEQEKLVDELASYGLAPCPEIIDLDGWGYYRLFESKRAAELRGLVADDWPSAEDSAVALDRGAAAASPQQQTMQIQTTVARAELAPAQSSELAVRESPGVPLEPVDRTVLPSMPERARSSRFGGWLGLSALLVIGIPSLLALIYFGFMASSQYVTNFQFAVRGPSQAAAGRAGGGALVGVGAMSPDAFVVTDYINSKQAISDVERSIDLQSIFSKAGIDFWSRLPAGRPVEELTSYWATMVRAHFDLISGNVSVSVRAFTPEESLRLARILVTTSDEMFRNLNTKAQQDFVRLADENLARSQEQLAAARQALLMFREKSGLVDADKTAQAGAAIIDDLRKQLAGFQSQYASIKASAPKSPMLDALNAQIVVLERQIKNEDALGSSTVKSVTAKTLAQQQSLELEQQSSEKQYTEALALRTQAYLTAQNQQSYLALFVAPTLANASLYPDRPKSIAAVVLAAAAAWFAGMLVVYALRDHLM